MKVGPCLATPRAKSCNRSKGPSKGPSKGRVTRFRAASWVRGAICCAVMLAAFDIDRPAHAYLDPGTGSIILQLLLGGIAGIAMVGKLYWHRLTSFFRRKGDDGDAHRPQG